MLFRVERSSADVRDGFDGTVLLFLFEGGAKPVDASVAVHKRRARAASSDAITTLGLIKLFLYYVYEVKVSNHHGLAK